MGRPIFWSHGVGSSNLLRYDGIAMENLCQVMMEETDNFKQAFSRVQVSVAQ